MQDIKIAAMGEFVAAGENKSLQPILVSLQLIN